MSTTKGDHGANPWRGCQGSARCMRLLGGTLLNARRRVPTRLARLLFLGGYPSWRLSTVALVPGMRADPLHPVRIGFVAAWVNYHDCVCTCQHDRDSFVCLTVFFMTRWSVTVFRQQKTRRGGWVGVFGLGLAAHALLGCSQLLLSHLRHRAVHGQQMIRSALAAYLFASAVTPHAVQKSWHQKQNPEEDFKR